MRPPPLEPWEGAGPPVTFTSQSLSARREGRHREAGVLSRDLWFESVTRHGVWTSPRQFAHVRVFLVPPPPPLPPPSSLLLPPPFPSSSTTSQCLEKKKRLGRHTMLGRWKAIIGFLVSFPSALIKRCGPDTPLSPCRMNTKSKHHPRCRDWVL